MNGILIRLARHRAFYPVCILAGVILSALVIGSGDDDLSDIPKSDPVDEPESPLLPESDGWVYGFIEYEHDIDKANLYYLKLQASPESKVPMVDGNFATTDVDVFVKLRNVDVGKALHHSRHRKRPHVYQRRERQRWAEQMTYLWNLFDQTHTFRVHNLKYIGTELDGDTYEDGIIEGDMELLLGGNWHNVAMMLMQDEHSRPIQADGSEWDAGSKEYSLLNPNVPK